MTNLQAALGVAQLERIEQHIEKKRLVGNLYNEGLKNLQGFQLPCNNTSYAENIYWVYGLVASTEELANETVKKLNDAKIGTRPFFGAYMSNLCLIKWVYSLTKNIQLQKN
jgi:perosamine synthetase